MALSESCRQYGASTLLVTYVGQLGHNLAKGIAVRWRGKEEVVVVVCSNLSFISNLNPFGLEG